MIPHQAWLVAALAAVSLHFEDLVRMSDRIVVATVQGPSGGSVKLQNGKALPLGVKDEASGVVFTPYRIVVNACVLESDHACIPGKSEISIPGGNVYETVGGEQRLRTWEVAGAAGVPMHGNGEELLIMMRKRGHRYMPLNDRSARVPVDRSSGAPSVRLSFGSPRFLSAAARESNLAQSGATAPSTAPPSFTEMVPLDDLKRRVALARQVPEPTSEILHAIPSCADANDARDLQQCGARVCAGEGPERSESPLELGTHRASPDGSDERRRSCGS